MTSNNQLFLQALGKFLLGVVIIGLLLFLPAGSLRYWQGSDYFYYYIFKT